MNILSFFKFLLTAIISISLFHTSAPAQGAGPDTLAHQQLLMPSTDCRFTCKNIGIHDSRREQGIIEPVFTTDRENQDAGRQLDQKYAFSLSYIHDEFSEYFDAWNSVFLQLSRETSIGSLIGRINMANRFDNSGVQPEIDFYPVFSEHSYGYFNFGISSNRIFPDYRFGAELYHTLPKGFELSAGVRHLRYPTNKLTIYTGSMTSYLGNWMITARPYFTPVDEGVSRSATLFIRKYFADADHYFTLRSGYGFSPEERTFQFGLDEIYLSKSGFIGLEGQTLISQNLYGFAILDFSRQEAVFEPDHFYTRVTLQIRFEYRF